MKTVKQERNLVVILFVLVLVVFSFAQRDSKKLEHIYASKTIKSPADLVAALKNTASSSNKQ